MRFSLYIFGLLILAIARAEDISEDASTTELPLENEDDIPVIEGHGGDVTLPEEDGVLVLNAENFDYVVSTRDPILIEFYAPWCGHCKSLAPEYAAAAKELKTEGLTIAKVDSTVETELAKKFGITGYPTLKLFRKGKPAEDFDGERTAQGIIEYMKIKSDPNYKPPPSSVVDLTDESFHDQVDSSPLMLVEFFAPWCGHCKKLAPEYEKAAKDLIAEDIPLAKVDATENKKVAEEYGVTGYPTLKVFRNGKPYEFKGGRDSRAIVAYMKDQKRLPSQEVRTSVNAKNSILKIQSTVFGYFSTDKDALYEEFISAANMMRGQLAFVHTFSADIAKMYNVAQDSVTIIMPEIYRNKFEDSFKTMPKSEAASAESMKSWLTKNSVPLLGERTQTNSEFLYSQRPLLVIYGEIDFSHAHIKATQHIRNKILPIADKYKGKITFALSNEENYEEEIKSVGLAESGESVNAALFTDKLKYSMEPDDEYVEELEEFLEKYEAGKLKPFLKSQPVPKKQKGPVKVMVAKNFEKEIMNGKEDYLVEFYAPWCGHCKKLEPIYKQLAKKMLSDKANVVIAKFDATANDLPVNFDVSGFPTIYFVKRNDLSNPVRFEGDRTLEGLQSFINEQQGGEKESTGKEEL